MEEAYGHEGSKMFSHYHGEKPSSNGPPLVVIFLTEAGGDSSNPGGMTITRPLYRRLADESAPPGYTLTRI